MRRIWLNSKCSSKVLWMLLLNSIMVMIQGRVKRMKMRIVWCLMEMKLKTDHHLQVAYYSPLTETSQQTGTVNYLESGRNSAKSFRMQDVS